MMKKNSKTKTKKIKPRSIKTMLGLIVILIAVYFFNNYGYVSTAVTYGFTWLFGNLFFLPFVLMVFLGFCLIFGNLFKKFHLFYPIMGIIFVSMATGILLSRNLVIETLGKFFLGQDLTFDNMMTFLSIYPTYNGKLSVINFAQENGGGFFGHAFMACFNAISKENSLIITGVFIMIFYLAGAGCFLVKPVKFVLKKFKKVENKNTENEDSEVAKENNEEVTEEIEDNIEIEKDTPIEDEVNSETENSETIEEINEEENIPLYISDEVEMAADLDITENVIDEEINESLNNTNKVFENITNKNVQESNVNNFTKPTFSSLMREIQKEAKPTNETNVSPVIKETNKEIITEEVKPNNVFVKQEFEPKFEEPVTVKETIEEKFEETVVEPINNVKEESFEPCFNDDIAEEVTENVTEPTQNEVETSQEIFTENLEEKTQPKNENLSRSSTNEINEVEEIETESINYDYEGFKLAPISLLDMSEKEKVSMEENIKAAESYAETINTVFEGMSIKAHVEDYTIGPTFTRFNINVDIGFKVDTIGTAINSIGLHIGGVNVRFQPIVPGRKTSAIEIKNVVREKIFFKEVLEQLPVAENDKANLLVPFGMDTDRIVQYGDISRFPHMLINGGTMSGKSSFLHSIILTLMMRNSPKYLKFFIIDPKGTEFKIYDSFPHMIAPAIVKPEEAKVALYRLIDEMESRLAIIGEYPGLKDIKDYNAFALKRNKPIMPYLIAVIDEYANLVDNDNEIGIPVDMLAKKCRSVGIHLVIALQRADANNISSSLKSNMDTKVALKAANDASSRIIIDDSSATDLLGYGDMLVKSIEVKNGCLTRLQGPFIPSLEVVNVYDFYKNQGFKPCYDNRFVDLNPASMQTQDSNTGMAANEIDDSLFLDAKNFAYDNEYISQQKLVTQFRIGSSRAARLMKALIDKGIVENKNVVDSKGRRVLVHCDEELNDLNNGEI